MASISATRSTVVVVAYRSSTIALADEGLLFTGGEDSWPFCELTPPVPRGHCPQFPDTAGGFLMGCLGEALALKERLGTAWALSAGPVGSAEPGLWRLQHQDALRFVVKSS